VTETAPNLDGAQKAIPLRLSSRDGSLNAQCSDFRLGKDMFVDENQKLEVPTVP
jgi:hypothetical protein